MHDNVLLGGPVWFFAQVLILGTIALSLFVLIDSLTPRRRRKTAGLLPEPLWVYSAATGAYLILLLAVQIIPGIQLASAVAAAVSPVALAIGVAYLLRAVFPKPESLVEPTDDRFAGADSMSAPVIDKVENR